MIKLVLAGLLVLGYIAPSGGFKVGVDVVSPASVWSKVGFFKRQPFMIDQFHNEFCRLYFISPKHRSVFNDNPQHHLKSITSDIGLVGWRYAVWVSDKYMALIGPNVLQNITSKNTRFGEIIKLVRNYHTVRYGVKACPASHVAGNGFPDVFNRKLKIDHRYHLVCDVQMAKLGRHFKPRPVFGDQSLGRNFVTVARFAKSSPNEGYPYQTKAHPNKRCNPHYFCPERRTALGYEIGIVAAVVVLFFGFFIWCAWFAIRLFDRGALGIGLGYL